MKMIGSGCGLVIGFYGWQYFVGGHDAFDHSYWAICGLTGYALTLLFFKMRSGT